MDKMLYISMSGLKQTLQAQATNSHNLANVSTSGFRANLQTFTDAQVYGAGFSSRSYSQFSDNGVDLSAGTIISTGKDLDIAIKGDGFIAAQGSTGQEGYTRAGNLKVSANGQLTSATGQPILGNGGPIVIPPSSKIEIGKDGTISAIPLGQGSATVTILDRIKLVNPDKNKLSKGADGLLYLPDNAVADADANISVVKGFVEGSNVNAIDAMVNMIDLARNFEMQSKMMKKSEEMDGASSRLLTMS